MPPNFKFISKEKKTTNKNLKRDGVKSSSNVKNDIKNYTLKKWSKADQSREEKVKKKRVKLSLHYPVFVKISSSLG